MGTQGKEAESPESRRGRTRTGGRAAGRACGDSTAVCSPGPGTAAPACSFTEPTPASAVLGTIPEADRDQLLTPASLRSTGGERQ